MSIFVVCPGCRKRFQVSDQFAGKKGPCPSCKTQINIPGKGEEVKIHAPEQHASGGRSATTGQLVLKPITRREVKFRPALAVAVAGVVVAVFVVAFLTRMIPQDLLMARIAARVAGLLAVSPPLVLAGYWFLRNDELEPYRGKSLYLRAGLLALVYASLWGLFALPALRELVDQFSAEGAVWIWIAVAPPFLIVGGLAALGCLDLEFGNAAIHYGFYVLTTVLLGWAAGVAWPWLRVSG